MFKNVEIMAWKKASNLRNGAATRTYPELVELMIRNNDFSAFNDGAVSPLARGYFPSLAYLAGRRYLDTHRSMDPAHYIKSSFVSGGTVKGMVEAQSKMARSQIHTKESPFVITTAVLRWLKKNKSQYKTAPLAPSPKNMSEIKIESSTSAGIMHNCERSEIIDGDLRIKYVQKGSKELAGTAVRVHAAEIVESIQQSLKENPNIVYDSTCFEKINIVSKMSMKPEVKGPDDDPYKTRIIFPVTATKTYLDRLAYGPIMERSYGMGANGIGHKWAHGGAARFAKQFDEPKVAERGWISLDISKFDQSVLASLLLISLFLPTLLYDRDNPDYKVVEQIIMWSLSNSVVKVVKWFGDEWKMMFGLMFSGELMTSLGDSWYLEIIFDCFDIYLYNQMGKPDWFKRCYRKFKDYGDDGVLGYDRRVFDFICPDGKTPTILRDYLKIYWHMDLKMSDTFTSRYFETRLNESCFGPEIVEKGPKFLKRYIIGANMGNGFELVPWRPTTDYFSRSSCIATSPLSIPLHLIRLRALAMDTMGTNQRAYEYLYKCHWYLLSGIDSDKYIAAVDRILSAILHGESEEHIRSEDAQLFDKIGGPSGAIHLVQGFPDIRYIQEVASNDDYMQQNIDEAHRRKLFMSPRDLMFGSD